MQRAAAVMNDRNLSFNTDIALRRQKSVNDYAEAMKHDPDKEIRQAKCLCVVCHYAPPRMSGAAMTSQPCMSCHENQLYSSTATDQLCVPCAKKHDLCAHCGADINLTLRPVWPKAYSNDEVK